MTIKHVLYLTLWITCSVSGTLHAQKGKYLGKQFLANTTLNGNPGWNDPAGERFWLIAWNQRAAVGLKRRLFAGVQSRIFWSKANDLPRVQTLLAGIFTRYYFLLPKGEKRRWAFASEMGNYWGNHMPSDNPGVLGVQKVSRQTVQNFGFVLERRLSEDLWIELSHNFLLPRSGGLHAYPSLGLIWHWGRAGGFDRRVSVPTPVN